MSSEGSVSTTGEVVEVILDRGITVSECCAAMVMATGLTGEGDYGYAIITGIHTCTSSGDGGAWAIQCSYMIKFYRNIE